jgi:adenylylsulfate kinase
MEIENPKTPNNGETLKRSLVKTVSYRIVIIILDFTLVYLFTKKLTIATGFTLISNLYTTFGYFLFERLWNKIKWGKINP